MKLRVKPLLACLLAATALSISVGSTYAYYVSSTTANNRFTVGENTAAITEEYTPVTAVRPGGTYRKVVKVTNEKSVDCYVRLRVSFSNDEAMTFANVNYNTSDWIESDGYWYYKQALPVGASTNELFSKVTFAPDAPEYLLDRFDIHVEMETVQKGTWTTYEQAWKAAVANK